MDNLAFDFTSDSSNVPYPDFSTTAALVRHLKEVDQDYEFYPSTDEVLSCVRHDMLQFSSSRDDATMPGCSVLDIGAGAGAALTKLTLGPRYAIEKSSVLVQQMPHDIFVIGSDFHAQSIIDKRVEVCYCNPPYKEFVAWSVRILMEISSSLVYLVIPQRWESSSEIQNAIKVRRAEATVIGQFDFLDAERQARCKVHVVRIDLRNKYDRDRSLYHGNGRPCVESFAHWFETEFLSTVTPDRSEAYLTRMKMMEEAQEIKSQGGDLIESGGLVNMLAQLYELELKQLVETYRGIMAIPADLVAELGIEKNKVRDNFQLKIKGLKAAYWKELFDRLDTISNRLTSGYRQKMLNKLHENTSVDFSVENASSIVLWVIKQANECADSQLVELVETMVEEANVTLYRSNARTIKVSGWRYDRVVDIGPFTLDLQFILHNVGALSTRGNNLIDDLCTVAITCGFDAYGNEKAAKKTVVGKVQEYYYHDVNTGKKAVLFTVRSFGNGNR